MNALNREQQRAYDAIKEGKSVLLQGAGGTGKSYTIKNIVKWARNGGINIGTTATTGAAAILINGCTLHSYLGVGLANKTPAELAEAVKTKKRFVYNRLLRLELLVIDEISMMDSQFFETVSIFLGLIKGNRKPFGGVQLLLSGDLYQLPPVKGKHFFKSQTWISMSSIGLIEKIELAESMRHKEDVEFMNMLSQLRLGACTQEILDALRGTKSNTFPEGIEPTILYSKNADVDSINNEKFGKLIAGGARSFTYKLECSSDGARAWATSCKIPDHVQLCVGAQVVLTWNIDVDAGLCNGARGVVVEVGSSGATVQFVSGAKALIRHTKVEEEDNKFVSMKFVPLRLAYALTINKAQGMTIDCAIVMLEKNGNNEFGYGRAYTALSRVRNIKSIRILSVTAESFAAHPDVLEFYKKTCAIGDGSASASE
jgi:ATP-dependent DNA helicase PIF1